MNFVDRSAFLASINYAKGQLLYRLGLRGHHSGSTAASQNIQQTVEYVTKVVADYLYYGAGSEQKRIEGKHILEVGPGDNLGVALLLLSLGASSVTCLDGYKPITDHQKNSLIYARLASAMTAVQRERIADIMRVDADQTTTLRTDGRLRTYYGIRIDKKHQVQLPRTYDIILSRAVLEHVEDIAAGWNNMVQYLQPDGEMWHKVDFRSHKMYDRIHPLYFLTFEEKLWKLISSPDPTLNRARLPFYRELVSSTFHSWTIYVTRILNNDELDPHVEKVIMGRDYAQEHSQEISRIRPLLKQPFRSYSDEDLLINGIFLRTQWKA